MSGKTIIARLTSGDGLTYSLSALLIIIAYHIFFGLETILPTNINWLMSARHDWGQHYLGWAFYRHEPWTLPLGEIDSLIYPAGTNVGYWDSIPLLAIFFKIFSALLPEDFQYLGLWMLSCYLMAGYYTIKICRLYTTNALYIIIAVLFVACNPVLVYRGLHPALCAHWFIIAAIYHYLKPVSAQNAWQVNRSQILLAVVSSLINPYICAMVLGFSVILPLRHYFYDKVLSLKKVLLYIAGTLASVLVLWLLVGMVSLGGNSFEGGGYGILSFNLNSLYNGSGFALLLPQMEWQNPGQYEGYMYLGAGMMAAIIIALAYLLFTGKAISIFKRNKYLIPLFVLALLYTLFAISNRVTYGNAILFEVPIPESLERLGSIFRACGRFLWPVYYGMFFFAIIILLKSTVPKGIKITVMALLLAVQLYDNKPLYTFRNFEHGAYDTPLDEARWNAVLPAFDRMITYPPFNNHLLNTMDYQDLAFVALKNRKAISLGYSARDDQQAYKVYSDSLTAAIDNDELRQDELYITTPQHINTFGTILRNKDFEVDYLDGYYLLYAKNRIKGNTRPPESIKKADSLRSIYSRSNFVTVIENPQITENKVSMNIEDLSVKEKHFRIKGWAFLDGKSNNVGDSVFVAVLSGNKAHIARTAQVARPDVTDAFKKENLEHSGFSAAVFTEGLETADYKVALAIKDKTGKWTFAGLGDRGDVKKKEKPAVLDKLPPLREQTGNVDDFRSSGKEIVISGWSAFKDADSDDNEIKVVFITKGANFAVATDMVMRPDVTAAHNSKYKYDTSGFSVKVAKDVLKKGEYKTGILLRNRKTGRESFMETDKTFVIK